MTQSKSYYEILGISPDAEEVVIHAAYRALAQKYHPDEWKGSPEEATQRMNDINVAYAFLLDRSAYRALAHKFHSEKNNGTNEKSPQRGSEINDAPALLTKSKNKDDRDFSNNSDMKPQESLMKSGGSTQCVKPELKLRIWNPDATVAWSFFLTPIFGAYLQMINWAVIGDSKKSSKSRKWIYAIFLTYLLLPIFIFIVVWMGFLGIEDESVDSIILFFSFLFLVAIYVVWYLAFGKVQPEFVKKSFGDSYQRRPWLIPILVAILASNAFYFSQEYAINFVTDFLVEKELNSERQSYLKQHSARQPILFSSFGMNRPALNDLIKNIELIRSQVSRKGVNVDESIPENDERYLSVLVTNRNSFGITGLQIGLRQDNSRCSWDDRRYKEIYHCKGEAFAKGSGEFLCDIPNLRDQKFPPCITGFYISGSMSEIQSFMEKYNIPKRVN